LRRGRRRLGADTARCQECWRDDVATQFVGKGRDRGTSASREFATRAEQEIEGGRDVRGASMRQANNEELNGSGASLLSDPSRPTRLRVTSGPDPEERRVLVEDEALRFDEPLEEIARTGS